MNRNWTRRDLLRAGALLGLAPAMTLAKDDEMLTRPIPGTDENMPIIGLGTYSVFDVAATPENIAGRKAIVDLLVAKGGRVIDTSPMYNRSEEIIGDIIEAGSDRAGLFLATKVWTDGKTQGEQQMARSAELMQTDVIDLMQVHNLRDLDTHMATIREWQEDKRIRYSGVTDYRASALDELEQAMRAHQPDFIQINYSLLEHAADQRVLPLAQELGIGVLVNRPFVAGSLFRAVGQRHLPDWARQFADSWGQFFLKFIVSHPAVSCAIPATSKPSHMIDNLGAGFGQLPDAPTRERMRAYVADL